METPKYLDVKLDFKLINYKLHVTLVENKVTRSVGILSKLRYLFPSTTLLLLYYSSGHGMVWNGMENGMERKFRYGIWKMPESNGMEDFKNGMEDNLPYFHSNSILDFLNGIYRKLYRLRIVISKNIKKRLAINHLSTNK